MAVLEQLESVGIAKLVSIAKSILEKLRYVAGDPEVAERAVFLGDAQAVTDAAVVVVEQAIDRSQVYSTLLIQFTQASGAVRYNITGRAPTQTRGLQFPAGGGMLEIGGAENIRNFQVICEAGVTANFTPMLFKAGMWNRER